MSATDENGQSTVVSKETSNTANNGVHTLVFVNYEQLPVQNIEEINTAADIEMTASNNAEQECPKDNKDVSKVVKTPQNVSSQEQASGSIDQGSPVQEVMSEPIKEVPDDLKEQISEFISFDDSVEDTDKVTYQCGNVTYTVLEGASQRRRTKLIDSNGFDYTLKRMNKDGSITWRCANRSKTIGCRVRVRQFKDNFVVNHTHSHPGKPSQVMKCSVVLDIKRKASQEMQTPVDHIVSQTLLEYVHDIPLSALPSKSALERQASRFRISCQKPDQPQNLKFTLSTQAIPEGFLRADIVRGKQRHLIFATEEQLDILSAGKRWYIDITTNMVKMPFLQLLSISCFVKKNSEITQSPLCFIIMSNKMKNDYVCAFQMLKRILPRKTLVEECKLDFDESLWRAFAQVYHDVKILGCSFLWTKVMWRKIQDVGLSKAYLNKKKTHSRLRKLMALPYLPCEIIPQMFEQLEEKIDYSKRELVQVYTYARNTWISDNSIWPPRVWSVYGQSVRTNNDVEGWVNKIKLKQPKSELDLYPMIKLLHDELSTNRGNKPELVKEEKLKRFQRKSYKDLHGKLHSYWNEFSSGKRTADSLLNACSHLYG